VGGGPAGLEAGIVCKELGANVIIIDDNPVLGGQLIKQTHNFRIQSSLLWCEGYRYSKNID
jgi:NADPH-dependent 2,4-dienoyl-CoA reductase/sulfur reductase-like enzyme